ncbi:MAG: RidA family protein [Bacillota bacterium]|nr:RidA family protein [Bacillota bacterium]
MNKKIVSTDKAPGAIGPYSQAVRVGDKLFTSGQLPMDPVSGELLTEIKAATGRCLENVKAILESEGFSMQDIIKTTVFMKNMDDFASMNEVYATYFTVNPPARSAVQVAKLPKDAVVEIEVIASK